MITFFIVIIILYFILKPDRSNSQSTNNQAKNNYKNTSFQTISSNFSNRVNGSYLVNGDLVTMSSGNTFRITEMSGNGTFIGINTKTNERISLYASEKDRFIFIDGIYVHEKIAGRIRQDNKTNTKINPQQAPRIGKDNVNCPRCQKKNAGSSKTCSSCGWKLTTPYVYRKVKLAGVTYENRQSLIARMSTDEELYLQRDWNNRYDRNAIGIFNRRNQSIGWVPKDVAADLAQTMDSGTEFSVKIVKKLGGNGYNYGLEVIISNDAEKLKGTTIYEKTPAYAHNTSSYVARSRNVDYDRYLDDEDEDYRTSSGSYTYDDYDYDDYKRDRDYDDFDEEAQGWEDLWEYNQNH